KDAFGLRGGASYWLNPKWEVLAGLGYDGNAVPDRTIDPALFDMDKVSASVGARVKLHDDKVTLALTYTHLFYLERTASVQARDMNGRRISFEPPSRNPDHGGRYSQTIGFVNLGLEYAF